MTRTKTWGFQMSLCTGDTRRGLHTDIIPVSIPQATPLSLLSILGLATSQQLPAPHSHWAQLCQSKPGPTRQIFALKKSKHPASHSDPVVGMPEWLGGAPGAEIPLWAPEDPAMEPPRTSRKWELKVPPCKGQDCGVGGWKSPCATGVDLGRLHRRSCLQQTKTPTAPGAVAVAHICDPSAQETKAGRWQVHPGHRVTISQNQNQKKACKMAERGFAT